LSFFAANINNDHTRRAYFRAAAASPIGAKAGVCASLPLSGRCGQPIRVYLPYLAEMQDEKRYRVVMDRERWFSVVMGEKFKVDARGTEKLASRIPLPESVAEKLAFRLATEKTA
jgi:hypothetical protein